MTIAQSYIACMGVSAALGGLALIMLFMAVTRRGGENLDDSGAAMLKWLGLIILGLIAAFWLYAGPRMPPGTLEKMFR